MAVNINKLITGSMRIVPPPREFTRIWWSNDDSDYSDCPANNGTFKSSCLPEGKTNKDAVKVEFGSDVTSIGQMAFLNCTNLTSLIVPDSVTSIMGSAFYGCSGLTSVTIGNGMTSIDNGAFNNCTNITDVYIGDIAKWCNINFSGAYSNPIYYSHRFFLNG